MDELNQAERVAVSLGRSADLVSSLASRSAVERIVSASSMCAESLADGGKLLIFGNGGSAADATHMAGEFLGRFQLERAPAAAISLSDNSSAVTAIGNDYGFEDVFSRQVSGLGVPGDVAIALSTSGRSANVIRGLKTSQEMGLKTIALVGADTSSVGALCDVVISVPSDSTPRIQEVHMVIAHVICELVEETLPPTK